MAKTLVLAEKPSVGREIAAALGCRKKMQGFIEGEQYIVTWALGHLVTLEDPEHYDAAYKRWSLETLPMLPKKMALKVIPDTAKQYKVVRDLLRLSTVTEVVIATDAGREGELVARWILEKASCKKPTKRLWISSQTQKAIREGFQNLQDGAVYNGLYDAAFSRAAADWLVGLNVTRALTCKFGAQLSAGRVQTPTLALIVEREKEIEAFRSRPYYTLRADLGNFFVTWHGEDGQSAIFDKAEAEKKAGKIQNATFTVTEVKRTKKTTPPPALYDLTELQRDANKQFGFSPKETLQYMQRLYEVHKALTYPRTDSRYLPADIVPTLPERLTAIGVKSLAPFIAAIRKEGMEIAKSCINDKKVTDHHAIIPTEQYINPAELSAEEMKIYGLVTKRFVACFYPSYAYESVKIYTSCEDECFTAQGRVVTEAGWRSVQNLTEEEEEGEQTLPKIQKGDTFCCRSTQLKAQKTTPPERYTEATLLSAMENPGKFIADKDMRAYIGGGLGTPATRADIIEKLYKVFYMEKKDGKHISPTPKAMQLIEIVPEPLRAPLLTAEWESRLEEIRAGRKKKKDFIRDMEAYAANLVSEIKQSEKVYVHENLSSTPCPLCGKMMLRVEDKKGNKMMVCSDRTCRGRAIISRKTEVRCPQCKKKMELFGTGEKQNYICSCGYREKAAEKSAGASRGEVRRYMSRQTEEAHTTLADALKKAFENGKEAQK